MRFLVLQSLNGLAFGGILFLIASGFSLIFGLTRVVNLAHGAFFMLGAYVGVGMSQAGWNFGLCVLGGALVCGVIGGLVERFVLRRLTDRSLSERIFAQVLITLGVAFVISDATLWIWGGDPLYLAPPDSLSGVVRLGEMAFPVYRLSSVVVAVVVAFVLWLVLDHTRLGAMVRAGVDNMEMARGVGIRVSVLFTGMFCVGAALAGAGGVLATPILTVYPGIDAEMLPLALVVVILGGIGSLLGAFIGSFVIGFIFAFGQSLLPDFSYVILFLPMAVILAKWPNGLFGRARA
jgi:branched-chain amino acid transport system permease protein